MATNKKWWERASEGQSLTDMYRCLDCGAIQVLSWKHDKCGLCGNKPKDQGWGRQSEPKGMEQIKNGVVRQKQFFGLIHPIAKDLETLQEKMQSMGPAIQPERVPPEGEMPEPTVYRVRLDNKTHMIGARQFRLMRQIKNGGFSSNLDGLRSADLLSIRRLIWRKLVKAKKEHLTLTDLGARIIILLTYKEYNQRTQLVGLPSWGLLEGAAKEVLAYLKKNKIDPATIQVAITWPNKE